MWAVAGLGNVGERYKITRHNVGYWVVDGLAARWRIEWRDQPAARIAMEESRDRTVMLIKPQLLMNRSGEALSLLGIDIEPDMLIVVHDDLDIPLGQIRIKKGGGSAGHRGIDSVAAHFGPGFYRVRVGIGKPLESTETVDYVLSSFSEKELDTIKAAARKAADAVECLMDHGAEVAMARYNRRISEIDAAGKQQKE